MKHGVKLDRQHNTSSDNRQNKVEFYLLLGFFFFLLLGWMDDHPRKKTKGNGGFYHLLGLPLG